MTRLWLVTTRSQAVIEGERVNATQAALWGLGRVIGREYPALHCVSIDLDADATDATDAQSASEQLAAELHSSNTEDQVAYRGGERYVARLTPHKIAAHPQKVEDTAVRLEIAKRGSLDQLLLQPVQQPQPGPGQVVIRVQAPGLNFRDVLNTLGMYPDDAGGLGQECAGTILAVGADVSNVSMGDSVVAMAPDSLGTYAIANAALVARIPSHLGFAEAATLPITFATAEYALNHLAQLKAGDRVLIHAAAGGVGLAAMIQVCMRRGHRVCNCGQSGQARLPTLPRRAIHLRLALAGLRRSNPGRYQRQRRRCRAQLAQRRCHCAQPGRASHPTAASSKLANAIFGRRSKWLHWAARSTTTSSTSAMSPRASRNWSAASCRALSMPWQQVR